MKETAKKPKTVLDGLDDEPLYDKPERNKPKIKKVEVLLKPKPASATKPAQESAKKPQEPIKKAQEPIRKAQEPIKKAQEPVKNPEIETENFNFDDDFGADNFPDMDSPPRATPATNGSRAPQDKDKPTNGDDLDQYIGDVSTLRHLSSTIHQCLIFNTSLKNNQVVYFYLSIEQQLKQHSEFKSVGARNNRLSPFFFFFFFRVFEKSWFQCLHWSVRLGTDKYNVIVYQFDE